MYIDITPELSEFEIIECNFSNYINNKLYFIGQQIYLDSRIRF